MLRILFSRDKRRLKKILIIFVVTVDFHQEYYFQICNLVLSVKKNSILAVISIKLC